MNPNSNVDQVVREIWNLDSFLLTDMTRKKDLLISLFLVHC